MNPQLLMQMLGMGMGMGMGGQQAPMPPSIGQAMMPAQPPVPLPGMAPPVPAGQKRPIGLPTRTQQEAQLNPSVGQLMTNFGGGY